MPVIIFLLGLILGSFLNVCIYRLPWGENIVSYPSHCPNCLRRLGFLDLLPLLSYVLLRGRCRYCECRISIRYPGVELLTGLVFLATYFSTGFNPGLLKYLFLFSVLIVVFFIDLDHKIIPNSLVLVILTWGILWQLLWPQITWVEALGGALLGGGFLLALAVISRGGMGGGDIKLMFAAGFYLGPLLTLTAMFIGFFTGALVGITLILLKVKSRKDFIPFGPFLSLGIFFTALWGQEIVDIYLNLTGLY